LRGQAELNRIGSRCTGKERDTESGNDYFGARYYASSMGRFMSPDWSAKEEPVPYAKLGNPQTLNLYSYVLNNPLIIVDTDGHELIVAAELQATVTTMRRESTSFNAEMSAYEGKNAPNLNISFAHTANDPSGEPSLGKTSVPLVPKLVVSSESSPDNISYDLPSNPTTTIKIDPLISGDSGQVQDVLAHETGHANDARQNTNQYGHDAANTRATNGKTPHDKRPEEQRANAFKDKVKQERKQYQKEHKHDNQ
jgi:RHS repeat-associated protein